MAEGSAVEGTSGLGIGGMLEIRISFPANNVSNSILRTHTIPKYEFNLLPRRWNKIIINVQNLVHLNWNRRRTYLFTPEDDCLQQPVATSRR
jgi:hypothetical protein